MSLFLLVVLVLAVVGAAMWLWARRDVRVPPGEQPARTDTDVKPPGPGAPSPRRRGRPVPGSRADRRRHGRP